MPSAAWAWSNLIFSFLVACTSFLFSTLVFFVWRWNNVRRSWRIAVKIPHSHFVQMFFLVFVPFFSVAFLLEKGNVRLFTCGLGIFLLSFLLLEILHRSIGLDRQFGSSYRSLNGPNGTQVEITEAQSASGMYPRNYMTSDFHRRIQYKARRMQSHEELNKSQGVQFGTVRAYRTIDFNVVNGLRATTDLPSHDNRNCLVFGTSQVFGEEVPDDLTCASFLQRLLNKEYKNIRVINHSMPASFAVERSKFLMENVPTQPGDILIFIFGSNDCGSKAHGKLSDESVKSPLLVFLTKFANSRSILFHTLFKKLFNRHVSSCGEIAVNQTKNALEELHKFSLSKKLYLIVVLQPTIYTSKRFSDYETKLSSRFSSILEKQIKYAYPRFIKWSDTKLNVVSLAGIFDSTSESVFLDWVHLNARGHELLAESLFNEIQSKVKF